MSDKNLELICFDGTTECIGVSEGTIFKPVVLFTINEERPRAFVLVLIRTKEECTAVYHEADALTIGN